MGPIHQPQPRGDSRQMPLNWVCSGSHPENLAGGLGLFQRFSTDFDRLGQWQRCAGEAILAWSRRFEVAFPKD
jgi:hypothetical protein